MSDDDECVCCEARWGLTCSDLQAAGQACGRAAVGGSEGGVHADDVAAPAGLDGFHSVALGRA